MCSLALRSALNTWLSLAGVAVVGLITLVVVAGVVLERVLFQAFPYLRTTH
jgi:hypothetical protein